MMRFFLLLGMVIGAAGLTIWIGFLAFQAGALNGTTAGALLPLLMLVALAVRALNREREK